MLSGKLRVAVCIGEVVIGTDRGRIFKRPVFSRRLYFESVREGSKLDLSWAAAADVLQPYNSLGKPWLNTYCTCHDGSTILLGSEIRRHRPCSPLGPFRYTDQGKTIPFELWHRPNEAALAFGILLWSWLEFRRSWITIDWRGSRIARLQDVLYNMHHYL